MLVRGAENFVIIAAYVVLFSWLWYSFRCMCKIDNCTYINILAELYENSSLVMNINNVFSSFVLFFFSGARILVQCRAKLFSVLKRLEQKTLWYLLMRYSECARDNAIHQNFLTSIESTCTRQCKRFSLTSAVLNLSLTIVRVFLLDFVYAPRILIRVSQLYSQ